MPLLRDIPHLVGETEIRIFGYFEHEDEDRLFIQVDGIQVLVGDWWIPILHDCMPKKLYKQCCEALGDHCAESLATPPDARQR